MFLAVIKNIGICGIHLFDTFLEMLEPLKKYM